MIDLSRSTRAERDVLLAALRAYENGMRATGNKSQSVRVRNDSKWRAWVAHDLHAAVVEHSTPERARR